MLARNSLRVERFWVISLEESPPVVPSGAVVVVVVVEEKDMAGSLGGRVGLDGEFRVLASGLSVLGLGIERG